MSAPATKQDLANLAAATKQDLADHAAATKKVFISLENRMDEKMEKMEKRVIGHFDYAVEHFKDDIKAVDSEKCADHEVRIQRLEVHAGMR